MLLRARWLVLLSAMGCHAEPRVVGEPAAPPRGVEAVATDASSHEDEAEDAGGEAAAPATQPEAKARQSGFVDVVAPPGTLLHAPTSTRASLPLVVFLHGMCANPHWECPVFRPAATGAWLLCPKGPSPCRGDGAMWTGTTKRLLSQASAAIEALPQDDAPDLRRRAIVGYSLGAPAALRIAMASPGVYQRLMVVNASVVPSAAQLEASGVTRVVLVAGDRDRTSGALKRGAQNLARQGVDARFFSMGPVGHYFDATSSERLTESLSWLTADWEPDVQRDSGAGTPVAPE